MAANRGLDQLDAQIRAEQAQVRQKEKVRDTMSNVWTLLDALPSADRLQVLASCQLRYHVFSRSRCGELALRRREPPPYLEGEHRVRWNTYCDHCYKSVHCSDCR